jgi:hypothetical protein
MFKEFPKIKLNTRLEKEKKLVLSETEEKILKRAKERILLNTLLVLEKENLSDLNTVEAIKKLSYKYESLFRLSPEIENVKRVLGDERQIASNALLTAYREIMGEDPKDRKNEMIAYETPEYKKIKNRLIDLARDYYNRLRNLLIKSLERTERDKENTLKELELEKLIENKKTRKRE